MGLQKSKEAITGQSGNYWHIRSYDNRPIDGACSLVLSLYKDKAARDAGKNPMEVHEMYFSGADWTANFTAAILSAAGVDFPSKAYPLVKAQAETQFGFDLSDAQDVDPDA